MERIKLSDRSLLQYEKLGLSFRCESDSMDVRLRVVDASVGFRTFFDSVSFRLLRDAAKIIQENHYYPFGQNMVGIEEKDQQSTSSQEEQKFQYNAKEKLDEFGLFWNDHGARNLDLQTGRWTSVDPLAEEYYSQSPYNFCNNNPILYNDPTGKSGEVTIDKQNKTVTVTSNMIFYGNSANANLATSTAASVQNMWNNANATVSINGTQYKVQFVVSGTYMAETFSGGGCSPSVSNVETTIKSNTDIKNNYIRVETTVAGDISYMDGAGSNTGYFKLANIQSANSTTEAHEMGHGWGAVQGTADGHPAQKNIQGQGQPGIMHARGTIVDPQYQYNPNVQAGQQGGTLDPEKRKVTQQDVNYLNLGNLQYNQQGKSNLGTLTNTYHQQTGQSGGWFSWFK